MIALITGANSGIGFITALTLAEQGVDLLLILRTEEKAQATKEAILKNAPTATIETYVADLEELESVKKVAEAIKEKYSIIDRIINNAGYSPHVIEFTADGYEKSFVATHLGHFVLVTALLNLVEAAPEGRIISLSSMAHSFGKVERMFKKNNAALTISQAYGDDKLANLLFIQSLATKLKKATAYSVHPGIVRTNFGSQFTGFFKLLIYLMKPFMISPQQGAATTLFLATTAPSNLTNLSGSYFAKSRPKKTSNKDITAENAELIWQKSMLASWEQTN